MKALTQLFLIPILLGLFMLASSCDQAQLEPKDTLSQSEIENLLFLLEEEKMARDVYTHFDSLYNGKPFSNIKGAEQRHMDMITGLLDRKEIAYDILPEGEFANAEIQQMYADFIAEGKQSRLKALIVGATIEDLDIFDIQTLMETEASDEVMDVYDKLQCASKNHMRSFVKNIEKNGGSYSPQYISSAAYQEILAGENAHCN